MSNEVQVFENKYLAVMANIALLEKQVKEMQEKQKALKADLEKAMDEYDIKSIDNDYLKITRVAASSSTSIDLKKLQEKEPGLYGELLEDYPKVTTRKAYVKFTVK
jgi:predicted phage-related endonuclease